MSWNKPTNLAEMTATSILTPASAFFAFGAFLRLKAYGNGILKRTRLPVPVISIGNITCGGTGKTPITIDLAQKLVQQGLKVAVLSRGYKRKSTEQYVIVSDGNQLFADAHDAGDEPYMIASTVNKAIVLVGANRTATGKIAANLYGCDVILLDDGFQHLALERDEDIVLIDYNDDITKDRLLPAGRLREPLSALARASWLVITKVPKQHDPKRINAFKEIAKQYAPNAKFTCCTLQPSKLTALTQTAININDLTGKMVFAFTGIARPHLFFEELKQLGATITASKCFPDHHWFSQKDINTLVSEFRSSKADLLVTTQKDAVRINPEQLNSLPVVFVDLAISWLGPVPLPDYISKINTPGLGANK